MPLNVGDRLGHYDVTALIGEGGMGQVYQATDTKLGRQVALKILPEAFAADPDRLARFQREAQVLASLNHPNIAAIHGIEETDHTRALVLELVEGPTLADRITQGPIPVDEALPIAKQIAEALEAAHEAGVIHRDLKPANIKVREDGAVKVLDFGLAKAFQPDASDPNLSQSPTISLTAAATQMGMVIGTAAYMAPEQAKGLPVDKRVDIWAYGAVLFEMLTGKKLFEAGDVSEMLASVLVKDPDVSSIGDHVPAHIRSVVRHCLVKDPTERLRDIGDVRLAIKGMFETTISAPPLPTAGQGQRFWHRPVNSVLVIVAALALGGIAVWSLTRPGPPRVARFAVATLPPPFVNPGATPAVVLTPDGSRIVYVAVAEGVSQLYVRALDQLDAMSVRGSERAINPFVSPDGNWIGYWNGEDGTLKKVSIAGGAPVTLTASDGIDGASWGMDDTIFFAMRRSPTGLLRVSAAGGDPEQVTTLAEGEIAHRWPHILPGGESLLFTVVRGPGSENMEVAALKLDTSERVPLVSGGSNPQYAPTGHLVYGVDGTLRAVPFDPDQLEVTGDPTPVLEGVVTQDSGAAHFSVAADGSLAYLPGSGTGGVERTLVLVDGQGNETPLDLPARGYIAPRLSPDGTRLAVDVEGENIDVWVSELALGTLRRLTVDPAADTSPVWTPDGERVVFASDRDGQLGLFSIAWDGTGGIEQLALVEDAQSLAPYGWASDGSLVFQYRSTTGSGRDVGLLAGDANGAWEPLLATEADEWTPAISPDGQWIAYTSTRTGNREVYVERFPELGGEQLLSRGGGMYPAWLPEGRELAYRVFPGPLMRMTVEAGERLRTGVPERAIDMSTAYGGPNLRHWDIAPDGQILIVQQPNAGPADPDTDRQMILIENWFEELTERVPVP